MVKARFAISGFALAVSACGGETRAAYEVERSAAVERAPSVAEDWDPDVAVSLSHSAAATITAIALESALTERAPTVRIPVLGGVEVEARPDLRLASLDLRKDPSCDACLTTIAHLAGEIHGGLGPLSAALPVTAEVRGAAAIRASGSELIGTISHVEVTALTVTAFGMELGPDAALVRRLSTNLAELTVTTTLTTIPDLGVPLLATRAVVTADSVGIEARTDALGRLACRPPRQEADRAAISLATSTVLGVLRRRAFENGVDSDGFLAVPESISLAQRRFTLGLRVWHLSRWMSGRRDFAASGTIDLSATGVGLHVDKVAASDEGGCGAGADPTLLVGASTIAEQIASRLALTWTPPGTGSLPVIRPLAIGESAGCIQASFAVVAPSVGGG